MPHLAHELDVRALAPRDRHREFFRAFDALAAGGAFTFVNDHDPKPLLYQLQNERPASFEWSVLEAGPERFRIEIRRRAEASSRDVSEFLGWDHDRLDQIFALVERAAGSGDFVEAGARFGEFRCGLERHIAIEEEVLFPVFEERTSVASGPTTVMREEHVEIKRLLAEICDALAEEDTSAFIGAAGELKQVLGDHNEKEEQVLYPMTDRSFPYARERDDLVRRMQAH